jgi:hypothetical protein
MSAPVPLTPFVRLRSARIVEVVGRPCVRRNKRSNYCCLAENPQGSDAEAFGSRFEDSP